MARSRRIDGPYELHPERPPPDRQGRARRALQRAGHGQICRDAGWRRSITRHLCSRPLPRPRPLALGRETAIQKCAWGDDGWLYLADGGQAAELEVPRPRRRPILPDAPRESSSPDGLPLDFQWLRTPHPERIFSPPRGPAVCGSMAAN